MDTTKPVIKERIHAVKESLKVYATRPHEKACVETIGENCYRTTIAYSDVEIPLERITDGLSAPVCKVIKITVEEFFLQ